MTEKVYLVSGWNGQTLTRYFGIFSSKLLIQNLFDKFDKILPDVLHNRLSNQQSFNIKVQEINVDEMFWYDSDFNGNVVFESFSKTPLQIYQFCQS